MVQCKKCRQFLAMRKDDTVECKGGCGAAYHKKCVRNIKSLEQKEVCEECSKKIDSPGSGAKPRNIAMDPSELTVESLLKEMNNKLEVIYKMEKNLEELKNTVDFYSEKYQELIEFKEDANKKIKSLEQKNVYLQKCNDALEERIEDLEIKDKESNIELAGLEIPNHEDLRKTVENIADKLELDPRDIMEVKRVGREKKEATKPQPVVITLKSKGCRDLWLAAKKTVITNKDIFNNGNTKRIFINEDLPRFKRQLFWSAKNELKDNWRYIWIQRSNILVRKEHEPKIYRIRSYKDIDNLKQQT